MILHKVTHKINPPASALHYIELEKDSPQQKTRATHTQHTQAYIKLHTSIYISIHTSNTYKHIHKTKQKQNTQITADTSPQPAPQKTAQQKNLLPYIIVSIV